MKTLLLSIGLCTFLFCSAQETYVPDFFFENYLENNGMGNGIPNDNYVTTANISNVQILDITNQGVIADLTGIEDFTQLTTLYCSNNQIVSLDLSNNSQLTTLNCSANFINSLDVTGCPLLGFLDCSYNSITTTIDLSNNSLLAHFDCAENSITLIDFTNNPLLAFLVCRDNQLTALDLVQNTQLTTLNCADNSLYLLDLSENPLLQTIMVINNDLTCMDLRNVDLQNILILLATGNSSLFCIEVDDAAAATATWAGAVDPQTSFSENCANPCSTLSLDEQLEQDKVIVKIVDLMGRETAIVPNTPLVYHYSDGSTERKLISE